MVHTSKVVKLCLVFNHFRSTNITRSKIKTRNMYISQKRVPLNCHKYNYFKINVSLRMCHYDLSVLGK